MEKKKISAAQIKAVGKYERNNYDKILVRVRRDSIITRETIAAAADRAGVSLNVYVLTAIKEKLEKDGDI